MSDDAPERTITADALETYLRCPRRYEFAHEQGLADENELSGAAERVDLLREAICAALRTARTEPDVLEERILDRLSSLWNEHEERFHSRAQRRFERRVLDATARAYVETVGVDHASGIERLRGDLEGNFSPVGPDISLSTTIPLSRSDSVEGSSDPSRAVTCESRIDYIYAEGSSLVGVRFVPTASSLGLLRYRSSWDSDVETTFVEHFDPDSSTFEPGVVAGLVETAIVLEGLRELAERLGSDVRTCRYVLIPLADRSSHSVNWVRENVEATISPIDLTEPFVDHQTFGMTLEHRNETVETRLAELLEQLVSHSFDPVSVQVRDHIASESCPDCGYAVCCPDYLSREVRFDG